MVTSLGGRQSRVLYLTKTVLFFGCIGELVLPLLNLSDVPILLNSVN